MRGCLLSIECLVSHPCFAHIIHPSTHALASSKPRNQALCGNLCARVERAVDSWDLPPAAAARACEQIAAGIADQAEERGRQQQQQQQQPEPQRQVEMLRHAEGLLSRGIEVARQAALAAEAAAEAGAVAGRCGGGGGEGGGGGAAAGDPGEAFWQLSQGAWPRLRLRLATALLAAGRADEAAAVASEVVALINEVVRESGGGGCDADTAVVLAGAAALLVRAELARGRPLEAAAALRQWLESGLCADAEAAAAALRALLDGCDLGQPHCGGGGGRAAQEAAAGALTEALAGAAAAAARAFPGCAEPTLAAAAALLRRAAPSAGPTPADALALRILSDGPAAAAVLREARARARCHLLLAERGAALLLRAGSASGAARRMLAAALHFSAPGAQAARTARLLAASCTACGDRAGAVGYLAEAARQQAAPGAGPADSGSLLMEVRVLLQVLSAPPEAGGGRDDAEARGLEARLARAIRALPAAPPPPAGGGGGGGPEAQALWARDAVLQAAYEECCAAGAWRPAREVLAAWRAALGEAAPPGEEAEARALSGALAVLGRLMDLLRRQEARSRSGGGGGGGDREEQAQLLRELEALCCACGDSLARVRDARGAGSGGGGGGGGGGCRAVLSHRCGVTASSLIVLGQQLADAAARAGAYEAAAELEQCAARLASPPCGCAECRADLQRLSGRELAEERRALELRGPDLDARGRGHLALAATVLLSAHAAAPGDRAPLERATVLLRRLERLEGAAVSQRQQQQQQQQQQRQAGAGAGAGAGAAAAASGPPSWGAAPPMPTRLLQLQLSVAIQEGDAGAQRVALAALAHAPGTPPAVFAAAAAALLERRPWRSEAGAALAVGFALRAAVEAPPGRSGGAEDGRLVAAAAAQLLRFSRRRAIRLRTLQRVCEFAERRGGGGGAAAALPRAAVVALTVAPLAYAQEETDPAAAAEFRRLAARLRRALGEGGGGGAAAGAAAADDDNEAETGSTDSDNSSGAASGGSSADDEAEAEQEDDDDEGDVVASLGAARARSGSGGGAAVGGLGGACGGTGGGRAGTSGGGSGGGRASGSQAAGARSAGAVAAARQWSQGAPSAGAGGSGGGSRGSDLVLRLSAGSPAAADPASPLASTRSGGSGWESDVEDEFTSDDAGGGGGGTDE